jgi:hypothetical protein
VAWCQHTFPVMYVPSCETALERPIQAEFFGLDGSVDVAKGVKGPVKPPPNGLKRLEERLTPKVTFPAYVRQNFDGFSKVLGKGGPKKWDEVADWWAAENDLTGDNRVSPTAMMRAYQREKARRVDLAKKAAEGQKPAPPPPPTRQSSGVRIIHPDPTSETSKRQEPARDDDLSAALDAGRLPQRPGKKPTGG